MTCRFRDEIEYEPVTFSGEIQKNSGLLFHLYDLAILSLYCFGSLDFAPGSAVSLLADFPECTDADLIPLAFLEVPDR